MHRSYFHSRCLVGMRYECVLVWGMCVCVCVLVRVCVLEWGVCTCACACMCFGMRYVCVCVWSVRVLMWDVCVMVWGMCVCVLVPVCVLVWGVCVLVWGVCVCVCACMCPGTVSNSRLEKMIILLIHSGNADATGKVFWKDWRQQVPAPEHQALPLCGFPDPWPTPSNRAVFIFHCLTQTTNIPRTNTAWGIVLTKIGSEGKH